MEKYEATHEHNQEPSEIDKLPIILKFNESEEMKELRQLLSEEEAEYDAYIEAVSTYQEMGESIVERQTGDEYTLAQIGLIVATANLKRDTGRAKSAINSYEDALTYLNNTSLDDDAYYAICDTINDEMSRLEKQPEDKPSSEKIANTLLALGEDYGFDKETCQEVAELSTEEAFEAAYGMILQAGLDPDEILQDYIK